jgi:hypothetical protein
MNTIQAGPALAAGLGLTDLSVPQLWGQYVALGGIHTLRELAAYLAGETTWSAHQHDIVAQALNEYTSDHGVDHPVSYADEL